MAMLIWFSSGFSIDSTGLVCDGLSAFGTLLQSHGRSVGWITPLVVNVHHERAIP